MATPLGKALMLDSACSHSFFYLLDLKAMMSSHITVDVCILCSIKKKDVRRSVLHPLNTTKGDAGCQLLVSQMLETTKAL
ncbi:unnamed protein product [Musa acuminata var. zebrina]